MLFKLLQSRWKQTKIPINLLRNTSNFKSESNTDLMKESFNGDFKNWKEKLHSSMNIYENFITDLEEKLLLDEVDPYIKRLKYEYDHWDDAIHGYRETEFLKWNEENNKIINKIREKAFPPGMPQLSLVHVLDLAEDGWIKPHVDSVRFCGEIIATISLLSDSVMRLAYVDHEKQYSDDFLIPRKSLYVMKGVARYKYKHEILSKKESFYKGKIINKTRRISIICRCEPE